MSRLDEIFEHKRAELALRKALAPLEEVMAQADLAPPAQNFEAALRRANVANGWPALIAEVKQASPSRGVLAPGGNGAFDPLALAQVYAGNGAAAISVLTDQRFFKGSLDDLRAVRAALPATPLLRKDFIFDPYQVWEARAAGADAILLIAAKLEVEQIRGLQTLAQSLAMAALVEVHTEEELAIVLGCAPRLVGINNRNLHDFSVRLDTTRELMIEVPSDMLLVAESGIFTGQDVTALSAGRGVDAVLVGEALVTAPDVAARVRELSGTVRRVTKDARCM